MSEGPKENPKLKMDKKYNIPKGEEKFFAHFLICYLLIHF